MKIIDRHVFKGFISIFLFCLLFLYVLFVIGDIFGFLDEILREGIGASSLGLFYFYMLPFVLTQIAPISCLLSVVFMLGNLNRYNEITALKASGVSLFRILRPVILASLVIGAFLFLLNDRIVPSSMRMANKVRYEKLEVGKRGHTKIIKNIAMYGEGNRIIFTREFDMKNNTLKNTIIHVQDTKRKLITKISVKKMIWDRDKWIGHDVVVYYISQSGDFVGTPKIYDKKIIPIKETPLDFINNQWQPQFMSYRQLKKYLTVFMAGSKLAHKRFAVDLHYKLSFPFSCLVMVLVAAPLTLVTSRGGALLGMAKGILVALLYVPLVAIGLALGKGGTLPPFWGAWFANIILGGFGLYRIIRH